MSDPRGTQTGAQVPPQTRGQEEMSATATPTGAQAGAHALAESPPEPTAWAGWIVFASMMMIMLGAFQAIAGIVALFNDGYYAVVPGRLVVSVDYTAWGWAHLLIGAVAVGTAVGLLTGQMWARVLGMGVAVVSALVNLAFVPAAPLWAIAMITLDVILIFAIAVHGAEMKNAAV
jgi:hypothetical protein